MAVLIGWKPPQACVDHWAGVRAEAIAAVRPGPRRAPATKVPKEEIFLLYALVESARALRFFDEAIRLTTSREDRAEGVIALESQSVFDALRSALHYTANVSKVFWPSSTSPKVSDRCAALRARAKLSDDHPLKDRRLRNHIEHLDERLDDWVQDDGRQFTSIEFVNHHQERREDSLASICVVYDAGTHEVRLFGEIFRLSDLRASVAQVQTAISEALGEGE